MSRKILSLEKKICAAQEFLAWAIPELKRLKPSGKSLAGSNSGHNLLPKLSEDVIDIRASKLTGQELAKKYGVSEGAISMIKSGQRWKHVR